VFVLKGESMKKYWLYEIREYIDTLCLQLRRAGFVAWVEENDWLVTDATKIEIAQVERESLKF
jgi:hypothetical protein